MPLERYIEGAQRGYGSVPGLGHVFVFRKSSVAFAERDPKLSSAFLLQPQALTHSMDTEARNTLEPGSPPYLALE